MRVWHEKVTHGSRGSRGVIDFFFVVQKELILAMFSLHLCPQRRKVLSHLSPYTKETCRVAGCGEVGSGEVMPVLSTLKCKSC